MITAQQLQERRLDELLRRQLGPRFSAAIGDPQITEIIVNEDGRVWFESLRQGNARSRPHLRCFAGREPDRDGRGVARLGRESAQSDRRRRTADRRNSLRRTASAGRAQTLLRHAQTRPGALHARRLRKRRHSAARPMRRSFATQSTSGSIIVIAGGTGSGKTTLAGALINEMVERSDPNDRYVIIEDTSRSSAVRRNLVQLHTAESADMTRLVRTTMRLRPDRIIIGEVRGAEALALLKAWNTGHPGGVTTIHANSATAALTRLSSLVQEAGVPPQPELIAETINLLAFIVRTPAGRRVRELVRVDGYSPRTASNSPGFSKDSKP